jgi:thiamine biosynthesis lipoprotein
MATAGIYRTSIAMDTLVSVEVPAHATDRRTPELVDRALAWFLFVEATCSRFDPNSELSRLSATCGAPVRVSPLLFQALQFAVRLAAVSDGAFDPTVGDAMARAGFTRNYRTGRSIAADTGSASTATFADIELDSTGSTALLKRPLTLDLGAVAKGLAIDLAAAELKTVGSFAIYAGGDIRLRGRSPAGTPWRVAIRHPRAPGEVIEHLRISDAAVCTSGDYERAGDTPGSHHLLTPATGLSAGSLASATVVARTAVLADALSTAAFVAGPDTGGRLVTREGAAGLFFTSGLDRCEAGDLRRYVE